MKRLLLTFLLGTILSASCYSQKNDPPFKIEPSGEKSFRVITNEDSIFARLLLVTDNQITRVGGIRKEDRKGKYWVWTAYFKNEDIAFVREQLRIIIK